MGFLRLNYVVDVEPLTNNDIVAWFREVSPEIVIQSNFKPLLEEKKQKNEDLVINRRTNDPNYPAFLKWHLDEETLTKEEVARHISYLEDLALKNVEVWKAKKPAEAIPHLANPLIGEERALSKLKATGIMKVISSVESEDLHHPLAHYDEEKKLWRFKFVWGELETKRPKNIKILVKGEPVDPKDVEVKIGGLDSTPWKEKFKRIAAVVDILPDLGICIVRYQAFANTLKKRDKQVGKLLDLALNCFNLGLDRFERKNYRNVLRDRSGLKSSEAHLSIGNLAIVVSATNDENIFENENLLTIEKEARESLSYEQSRLEFSAERGTTGNDTVDCHLDAITGKIRFSALGAKPEEVISHALRKFDDKLDGVLG